MNQKKKENQEDLEGIELEINILRNRLFKMKSQEIEVNIESQKLKIRENKNSISNLEQRNTMTHTHITESLSQLKEQKKLELEISTLLKIMKSLESKIKKNEGNSTSTIVEQDLSVDMTMEEINFKIKKYSAIKDQLSKENFSKFKDVQEIEQKKRNLVDFKQKLEYIKTGISKFKEAIEQSQIIADEANISTFTKINSNFQLYFSKMIPNKVASLKMIGPKIVFFNSIQL
jgi:chromosome segregation ATPase